MSIVRIGILSTADISRTHIKASKNVPTAKYVAVSSRDLAKAKAFAAKHGIDHAMTNDQLIEDTNVDAVYLPIPTTKCLEWGMRAANNGKHILVDKPFTDAETVKTLKDVCEKQQVIFMDATHFVHSKRTKEVRELVQRGEIGELKTIFTPFHAPIGHLDVNIRGNAVLEPYGALGDLGWYSVRAIVAFLGIDKLNGIKDIVTMPTWHPNPKFKDILQSVQVIIKFDSGLSAVFSNHFQSCFHHDVQIIGTLGSVSVPQYVAYTDASFFFTDFRTDEHLYSTETPYKIERNVRSLKGDDGFEVMYPKVEEIVVKEDFGWCPVSKLLNEFCRMIIEKDMEASRKWTDESLATQTVLDRIFRQVKDSKSS